MSQRYYNNIELLVFETLLRKNNHIRGLARELRTNQTTVARKVTELGNANILDFTQEGKNKVFFIKKTLESKQYALIMEQYKLLRVLKQYPLLRRVIESIKGNKKINMAILFGSYAKGLARTHSDIDIYVETGNITIKQEISAMDSKISVKIGKFDQKNLLIKEIIKDHAIIKGTEVFYEKAGIFE